jgi:hypothetical protein
MLYTDESTKHDHPRSPREGRPWGWITTIAVASVLGMIIVLLLVITYYSVGNRYGRNEAIVLHAKDLQLMLGEGELTEDGLVIRRLTAGGGAYINIPIAGLETHRPLTLEWRISGWERETEVYVVWQGRGARGSRGDTIIPFSDAGSGRIIFTDWATEDGIIANLGLVIQGALPAPLTVHELVLRPTQPKTLQLLEQLWQELWAFEGWGGYSVNFIFGGKADALFPLVIATALWVAISALVFKALSVFAYRRLRPPNIVPIAVFFLTGWIILDARWQIDLWQQLRNTHQLYGNKSLAEKRLVDKDADIYRDIREIANFLPKEPARIFVVSADPKGRGTTEYLRLRSHYHLLPHNVYSESDQPPAAPHDAHSGDYVLILKPMEGLSFSQDEGLLRWGHDESIPVELVTNTSIGVLFRII